MSKAHNSQHSSKATLRPSPGSRSVTETGEADSKGCSGNWSEGDQHSSFILLHVSLLTAALSLGPVRTLDDYFQDDESLVYL